MTGNFTSFLFTRRETSKSIDCMQRSLKTLAFIFFMFYCKLSAPSLTNPRYSHTFEKV